VRCGLISTTVHYTRTGVESLPREPRSLARMRRSRGAGPAGLLTWLPHTAASTPRHASS
jgi:hypothetical protein